MRSSDDLMQNIDVALANFGKRCRFVTPIPEHLRAEVEATSSRMSLTTAATDHLSPTKRALSNAEVTLETAAVVTSVHAPEIVAQQALEVSREAVPNLASWFESVRRAKTSGESALQDAKFLTTRLQAMNDVTVAVRQQNDMLSANASTLVVRKTRLEAVQETLQKNIRHFTRVEDLVREVAHPMLSASTARFPVLLEDMEETMQFLSDHHYMKSASAYASNLAMAQQRALLCLKDGICQTFSAAITTVGNHALYSSSFRDKKNVPLFVSRSVDGTGSKPQVVVVESSSTTNGDDEGEDEGVSIVRFVPLLATLNDVFLTELEATNSQRRLAESRCLSLEDDVHLGDMLATYRDVRLQLLSPLLRDWLVAYDDSLKKKQNEGATDGGVSSLLRDASRAIVSLLQGVLQEERSLYERLWLREDVVRTFDTLYAKDISEEFYHHFRSRLIRCDRLEELALATDAFQSLLQDEESLRAGEQYELVLKKMLQDAQERIVFRTSVFLRTSIAGRKFTVVDATGLLDAAQAKPTSNDSLDSLGASTSSSPSLRSVVPLHPFLQDCLRFLDMLYTAVDRNVFNVFAEECVHMTLVQLGKLATIVAQQRSDRYPLAPLHARLVHLAHLLALREGIVHYDANLSVVEKTLDLSQLAQRRLEILQSSREAKKDIETDLRRACEEVIDVTSREAVDTIQLQLKQDASATANKEALMESQVRGVEVLLAMFVENAGTRNVLLRPIRANLEAALRQVEVTAAATTTKDDVKEENVVAPEADPNTDGVATEVKPQ